MPDREYPAGALEALSLSGLIHHRTVTAQLNALAAMSPEDRAALARRLCPEGREVFAIGQIDYDVRTELPHAIFATLDAAKAHAGHDLTWRAEDGGWYASYGEIEWVICCFAVGGPDAVK